MMASSDARIPISERIYAIGDIHGRLDLLERVIAAIRRDVREDVREYGPAALTVTVGDYIDRGPRSRSVRISMDDFGTGYSSLSYLRSFPFDKIKIDRSFIRELGKKGDCIAIIRAVARLGSNLGMTTIAEGVESQEQLEILRAEGCTHAQGYLFSPPRPVSEVPKLLHGIRPRVNAA